MLNVKVLIKLWKQYMKQYNGTDFISFSIDGIHVRPSAIRELADKDQITVTDRHAEEFPYRVSTYIDGVEFFGLGSEKDILALWPNYQFE